MDNELRKRLAEKSGDYNNNRPPKYVVPLIRFDGNKGTFRKVYKDKDGEDITEELGENISFVILKKRRLLSSFSPTTSYFTNEHNTTSDKLILSKVIGKTVTFETTGYTDELREKYQSLKTHEVIYVLFGEEVCRMEIKGGSLAGYYEYQKALSSEEKHSFEVITNVGSEKAKNEQGFGYYKMTFDFEESTLDTNLLEEKIDEVLKATQAVDDYVKNKINEKGVKSSKELTPEEKIAVQKAKEDWKALTNEADDDINPNDIPF